MSLRRFVKYGFALGATLGTASALQYNNWDFETFGAIRLVRAACTVGKISIDYKISLRGIKEDSEEYQETQSQVHRRSASRLLDLCCTNGGVFIKVGQHLGALDYLLPPEYVSTFKVLYNQGPKSSIEDVFHVIRKDFKREPLELFSSFDPEPIGAASLAQVHKAVTKDGATVAVKVQHRFVRSRSFVDMMTMEVLVHLVAWAFPEFQFMWLAEETKKNLPQELDFVHEGMNAERVRRMFSHYRWFKVPSIHWDLSSTRVLTMEFCEGGLVNDIKYMEENRIPVHEVTRNLGKLYSEMIFVHGYIHCDPHPGNILVNNRGGKLQIVLLDHGLYNTLTDSFRLRYANIWLSLLNSDVKAIEQHSEKLGVTGPLHQLLASMMTARPWKSVASGIKTPAQKSEGKEIKAYVAVNLHLISKILNLVPREMLLIFKTNDLLRNIEFTLKSPPSASSFINMSRCCVRAIAQDRLQQCDSICCLLKLKFVRSWTLLKINLYELFVWLSMSLSRKMIIG